MKQNSACFVKSAVKKHPVYLCFYAHIDLNFEDNDFFRLGSLQQNLCENLLCLANLERAIYGRGTPSYKIFELH